MFSALSAHHSFVPSTEEEGKAFPSGTLSRCRALDVALFQVVLQKQRGKRCFREELQIPAGLSECAPVWDSGSWHEEQEWSRNPGRDQSLEHPSTRKCPEPAWLYPCNLHGWKWEEWAMVLEMSQLWASPRHWQDTGCREELHQHQPLPQEQLLLLLSCNKRQQVIEGPSVGQQEPDATSCLSPAPGQDTQEVTGDSWAAAGCGRMVASGDDSGITGDMWSPPSSQSSSLLPEVPPQRPLHHPSLLSHAIAHLPRKSKDLMLL